MIKKFPFVWNLADLEKPEPRAPKVFSTFACGGGSTMGYEKAGCDVVGCNEIDPKIFAHYDRNFHPRIAHICSIRDMIDKELEPELYGLDILDGSPPCSTFSMSGNREKDWGKKKQFSEGQAHQRLDDLFFSFIDLAAKLKPKVVVAENVTGILLGKSKGYVKEIVHGLSNAGYDVQIFKLNGVDVGLPQRRVRVFFIARRRDLNLPALKFEPESKHYTFGDVAEFVGDDGAPLAGEKIGLTENARRHWNKCEQGKSFETVAGKGTLFSHVKIKLAAPANTLVSGSAATIYHPTRPRFLTFREWQAIGSFPQDYNYGKATANKRKWLIGMSVPPLMAEYVAKQIKTQWFDD